MTQWRLLIGTAELFGNRDDLARVHDQLTAAGVENYLYRRDRDFDSWLLVG